MGSRRNVWVIVIVVVVLLMCCCAVTVGAVALGVGLIPWGWETGFNIDLDDFVGSGVQASSIIPQELFEVGGQAEIEVNCPACNLEINAVSGSDVEVEGIRRAWAGDQEDAEQLLEKVDVSFSQQGARVTIDVESPIMREQWPIDWRGARRTRVDLEITVPVQTDVKLDVGVGDVEISRVEGQVDLQVDVGDVSLQEVVARDEFKVRTDVARIRFEGPLSDGVRYDIRSDVGEIVLSLPADSSFEIDAESNVGSVATEFDVRGADEQRLAVGGRIKGEVGDRPTAELDLDSEVGSIRVNKY